MLRRIRKDELQGLAARSGIVQLKDEDLDEYLAMTVSMLDTLEPLDSTSPPQANLVSAGRNFGRPATRADDPLNAVIRWCSVRGDYDGPMKGKRIGLKDSIALAGMPLTCGSRVLQDYVPQADSVVAERVLRAGGEIVAILNMDNFAFSGGGDTSHYGPTLNPHDPTRTAGGSSSGPAAALSYDGIDITYGTDQGGSIRLPAAWCGVLGIKPSFGIVPYTGIVGVDQTYDHVGPFAKTAEDLALGLEVVAGSDDSDPRQKGLTIPTGFLEAVAKAPESLDGLTLGLVAEGFDERLGVESATARATMEAVERMRGLGADVREISVPSHRTGIAVGFASFVEGVTAAFASYGNGYHWSGRYAPDFATALGRGLSAWSDELPPQIKVSLLIGTYLRERYFSSFYAKAQNLRPLLRQAYDDALATVDVLLMPTATRAALPYLPDLSISERVSEGWSMLGNTTPFNMTGHPSISIPAAEASGLPIGVMLTGRMFDDARLLSIARTYERAHGWLPAARNRRGPDAGDPGRAEDGACAA